MIRARLLIRAEPSLRQLKRGRVDSAGGRTASMRRWLVRRFARFTWNEEPMRKAAYMENGSENLGYETCELCGAVKAGGESDPGGPEHPECVALRASFSQFERDPVDWMLLNLRAFSEKTLEEYPGFVLGVLCRLMKFVEEDGGTRQGAEFRLSHLEPRFKQIKWLLRRKGEARL